MSELKDIKFYQVLKKRPQGVKKTKWVRRRANEDTEFMEKVKVIRMRAEKINKLLID